MRRILAALAAAALVLSSVGSAVGAEPEASQAASAAPSVAASVDPAPSGSMDPQPGTDSGPGGSSEPGPNAAVANSDARSSAPVVSSAAPHADGAPTDQSPPAPRRGPRSATDPTGRWIVLLKAGSDAVATADRQGRKIGFTSDRVFRHAFRGYSAVLEPAQVTALRHDPAVSLIVADERIEAEAQTTPTGISRIGANRSLVAKVDGVDQRVDADVAIVDTGIASVTDLNVAGGYNCSTSDRALWRDVYGHGTHVAGTVGAIDNGSGVVGVAPGVRLWAVKILDDTGSGLLSWYVCGLDWIAAQRDPASPARPLFESVNMSVAKSGRDDVNCGLTNKDVLHQAICRLVSSGVTVVAAAANDSSSASTRVPAAYNEVITVSALADTDGKPGGLGGNRCYSWGTYDVDDTFASFSNYGSDVDLIAPGKCIWSTVPSGYRYSSGTSMAAPHVAGAVALLKSSRPGLTPAEVREALQYLGTLNWRTSTDPDRYHERLLDVTRIGPRGTFGLTAGGQATVSEAGGVARLPVTVARSATSFERVRLSVTGLPSGATASFDPISVYGFGSKASTLTVTVPRATRAGTYVLTVTGDEHGTRHTTTATIEVTTDRPVAAAPSVAAVLKGILGSSTVPTRVSWPAAHDPSTPIAGYELQTSLNGGSWSPTATTATVRSVVTTETLGQAYRSRVRARDSVGNWSAWAAGATATPSVVNDRSTAIAYTGAWAKAPYSGAFGGSTTYATAAGARARLTFTGRSVALVAPVGPTRGSASIWIDGVNRGTVGFSASAGKSRVVMYSATLSSATHTIEVRLAGTGRVDIDGFVIFR